MTPEAFRAAVERLQWSYRGLADMVQVDERQVRRWAAGAAVPAPIAAWIERAARELGPLRREIDLLHAEFDQWIEENPPPAAKSR